MSIYHKILSDYVEEGELTDESPVEDPLGTITRRNRRRIESEGGKHEIAFRSKASL